MTQNYGARKRHAIWQYL